MCAHILSCVLDGADSLMRPPCRYPQHRLTRTPGRHRTHCLGCSFLSDWAIAFCHTCVPADCGIRRPFLMRNALSMTIPMDRNSTTAPSQLCSTTTPRPTSCHPTGKSNQQSSILSLCLRLSELEGCVHFVWKSELRLVSRNADISLTGIVYIVGVENGCVTALLLRSFC
jgi:hypothetical protein